MNRELRILIISVIIIQSLFGVAAPAWAAMRPSFQSTRDISHPADPIPTISLMNTLNVNGGFAQYQGYSSAKRVVSPEISSAIRERQSSSSFLSSSIIASGTTRVVTNAADSGPGTFRQALLDAQAGDTILFDTTVFPPTAPTTITLSDPLPDITQDGLSIDGSQAGVVLTINTSCKCNGLVVRGTQYVTIRGLRIQSFPKSGIALYDASHNIIGGSRLIGAAPWGQGNVIYQNGLSEQTAGVRVVNSIDNTISGSDILENAWGILVGTGSTGNTIGGTNDGMRNVISGNANIRFVQNDGVGILFQNGAANNQVIGNFIGTDSKGTSAYRNIVGIVIGYGANHNIIGGTTPGARNLISGNTCSISKDCMGIQIQNDGTTDNQVIGNYIGVDVNGTSALGNDVGIVISGAANMIGGTNSGSRNVISGNIVHGIFIQNGKDGSLATGNQVLGNYIGLNSNGTSSLGNGLDDINGGVGVALALGANNNTIGGTTMEARNVISGNKKAVQIQDSGTSDNRVVGNYIGTDVIGSAIMDNYIANYANCSVGSNNSRVGITIFKGPKGNRIGGPTPEERNVIGGTCFGVAIAGLAVETSGNQVMGNYIGLDATGTYTLKNNVGVDISKGAANNTIGGKILGMRNVISGYVNAGIQISESATNNNQVMGNFIGTDPEGQHLLGTGLCGILIGDNAQYNQIGGTTDLERNIISGNEVGIGIKGVGVNSNQVIGNYIGTDVDGAHALGNVTGVSIFEGARDNLIGGMIPGARNVISGNAKEGVKISGENTQYNQVSGNFIGVDSSGLVALGNKSAGIVITDKAQSNQIGGTAEQERNIISGNETLGIQIQGNGAQASEDETSKNLVLGNYIGTNLTGDSALSNGKGIEITEGAQDNTIGGNSVGAINLISGNTGAGIVLRGTNTKNNRVPGNYIGTNISGMGRIANGNGIEILASAQNNLIGCSSASGSCNLISANNNHGIWIDGSNTTGNHISGNYIGVNIDGTQSLSNGGSGIVITNGADANVIGGDTLGSGNLISGNDQMGISIQSASNQVQGNLIGVNASGLNALGNAQNGIIITGSAAYNTIGGTDIKRNIISGNGADGIRIDGNGAAYNQVQGNFIGTDINGVLAVGNGSNGVEISSGASHNVIGVDNTISGNAADGVLVNGTYTVYNMISRNSIHHNGSLPIWLMDLPVSIAAPEVNARVCTASISGRSCPGCRVEIFGNPDKVLAGTQFLASANADASGNFSAALVCSPENPYLSFTMTTPDDTTSEYFSGKIRLVTYLPLALRP